MSKGKRPLRGRQSGSKRPRAPGLENKPEEEVRSLAEAHEDAVESQQESAMALASPNEEPLEAEAAQSPASATGTYTGCQFEGLVVAVHELEEEGGRFVIVISDRRPKSNHGRSQGDHVSAYLSFLQMLATASEGHSPQEVCERLKNIAIAVMPDKAEVFNTIYQEFETAEEATYLVRAERKAFTAEMREAGKTERFINQLKASLKHSERGRVKTVIATMCKAFLTEINRYEGIAFPREGELDTSQGERVKLAIHALKALNDIIKLDSTADASDIEERLEHFYDYYLKPKAKYKDGLNKIAGNDYVEEQRQEWENGRDKSAIVHDICQYSLSNLEAEGGLASKAAEFFGDTFDLYHSKHPRIKLSLLYETVARHLVIMFLAFDQLQNYSVEHILHTFLRNEVLGKAGWANHEEYQTGVEALEVLQKGVREHARLEPGNVAVVPSALATLTEPQTAVSSTFVDKEEVKKARGMQEREIARR